MSAFEVKLTPTRGRSERNPLHKPTDVVMAPFSSKSIVQFEDIPMTKTAKRTLNIVNPSEEDIKVKVTKFIRSEYNVTIDWTENVICAQGQLEMHMTWCPEESVCCTETMQLTDNRNLRRDVKVILKSSTHKPKTVRKFPTLSSGNGTYNATLRLKSPANSGKCMKNKSVKGSTSLAHKSLIRKEQGSRRSMGYDVHTINTLRPPLSQIRPHPRATHISPLIEINQTNSSIGRRKKVTLLNDNKYKENVSPMTPNTLMNIIDGFNFTPLNLAYPKKSILTLNANTPTTYEPGLVAQTRPRRIMDNDLSLHTDVLDERTFQSNATIDLNDAKNATTFVANGTFEVKDADESNLILENLNISTTEAPFQSCSSQHFIANPAMNKTETFVKPSTMRYLDRIQEEDSKSNCGCSKLSVDGSDSQASLMRDVKLVATPLSKHSLSLRNLTSKSPQSKPCIQGSMPNLNNMTNIDSIECNRYFHQASGAVIPHIIETPMAEGSKFKSVGIYTDSSSTAKNAGKKVHSPQNLVFNQNEILAQSSRFNLNELDKSKCNASMSDIRLNTSYMFLVPTPAGSVNKASAHYEKIRTANEKHKSNSRELYFDLGSSDSISRCENDMKCFKTPVQTLAPKRIRVDSSFSESQLSSCKASRLSNESQTPSKKFGIIRNLRLMKKPTNVKERGAPLYDTELYLQSFFNPDPFAATTTCDPFVASTMYLDNRAVEKHHIDFKKWLNALVSIPDDLTGGNNVKIDVAKLFNEARNKDLTLAPTKEEQSENYLTKVRLDSLRRSAVQLFMSEEMQSPCTKVAVYVKKNCVRIRCDRNLHLDVVLQRYILSMLLCFNPLWLRLGLEVVYGEEIPMNSNHDVVCLTSFIVNRLFRDKLMEQRQSKAYTLSAEYGEHIKKFTLQKLLLLLLFLDKAKERKIIKHNPCLFLRNSPHKDIREILLKFASELLANVGDITRDLKRLGYVLQHKQTYLDEFNYAFENLAVDLRDGIRLSRVMEIILLRDDLHNQLRVPAISRLQRIHNVNLSLNALANADFQLKGNITAADIVDGHREKTLSLLWQIIYKFRSPKFHAAAKTIQNAFRRSWLRIVIQKRIKLKRELKLIAAATKIQAAFRGYCTRQFIQIYKEERTCAAIVLQKYCRRHLARKQFDLTMDAVLRVQRWYRQQILGRNDRKKFVQLRQNCIYLQRHYRRKIFAKKLTNVAYLIKEIRTENQMRHQKANVIKRFMHSIVVHRRLQAVVMRVVRDLHRSKIEEAGAVRIQSFFRMVRAKNELRTKQNAIKCIQYRWRSYQMRKAFILKRNAVIAMQRKLRSKILTRRLRSAFVELRLATMKIQQHFRGRCTMIATRERFLQLRRVAIIIQRRRRSQILMRAQCAEYLQQRTAIVQLQRRYRALQSMRQQRQAYLRIREMVLVLQRHHRSRQLMKRQVEQYCYVRQCVIRIQHKWRSIQLMKRIRGDYISLKSCTIMLQQRYRAKRLGVLQRSEYMQLRMATICVQRRVRATLQMRCERQSFERICQAARTIQQRYRAYRLMRLIRARYQGTRNAVLCIQERVRSYLQMKRDRVRYVRMRHAAVVIQSRYRANVMMLKTQGEFQRLRSSAICMQRRYRANKMMQRVKGDYQRYLTAVLCVQRRFRAKLLGRTERKDYARCHALIVMLQRRYRAKLLGRATRQALNVRRTQAMKIQRYFRSYLAMKKQVYIYQCQRQAARRLQEWYRNVLEQRKQREHQRQRCNGAVVIQQRWRAILAARQQRQCYVKIVEQIVFMQRRLRCIQCMRKEQRQYQQLKSAAIIVQRRYRARMLMQKERQQYLHTLAMVISVQRRYRARRLMLQQRNHFVAMRCAAIKVQRSYRAFEQMRTERQRYLQLRDGVTVFQAHVRGFQLRQWFRAKTPELMALNRQRRAAIIIQRYWRGYCTRKSWHNRHMQKIRSNIRILKRTASTTTCVGRRIEDAVFVLNGKFSATDGLSILRRLDRFSRTVPHLIQQSAFISNFCYGIMAQAIRSEIDKANIEHCSRIILNLVRYDYSAGRIVEEVGLVTVAQMLLRWCDKDCDIFNTLCTLIYVLCHCPRKKRAIRQFMTTTDAIYMVRETKKLVARKEKMRNNVRNCARAGNQQLMPMFPETTLPSLMPDYGLIRHAPYIFQTSVFAFNTILEILGIDI